ncbi:MAG: hypothetical protein JNL41_00755 [Phenylobacterium sp.]|uniref:hypothetical protein n=1 Tax=Phenylobacterium sp. TaxID=1871053 RepID=UPI001A4E52C7|nr:hypothetical protein [Phenylobacterium sp.]MBL8552776.1 hypothetical protein [Phenylobacterium sp.]
MLAGLRQALMSPVTGPIATAIAFTLAVGYGVSASTWKAEKAGYERRIADLTQASDKAQGDLRNELAACHAAGAARQVATSDYVAAATPDGARRLLERRPEGIDACARMESADRAVLSNLKKK